jgi:hypothetical protein
VSRADWERDPEWLEFVDHVRRETMEGIAGSGVVVSLAPGPGAEGDVKYAVELGLSIMLDKPLLVVVTPGVEVPPKLRAVADEVVEADVDLEQGQRAVAEALKRIAGP